MWRRTERRIDLSFNPRSRTGSDDRRTPTIEKIILFQSTLPHGERRLSIRLPSAPRWFQSTLPHGERRQGNIKLIEGADVSIHAPARGATSAYVLFLWNGCVSIHAPARGATCTYQRVRFTDTVSIHAPARGATGDPVPRAASTIVSIHAPARGATYVPTHGITSNRSFNPRSRTGSDSILL
ncbi:hypothetical protein SAMN06296020_1125 [Anoxynatronum buryatiense]|uniref:Uncharacterized protein n=1 Tax=Anoxynatronum buryatiense TaxID=489973 RepID=A0AA45WXH3_9CLOT|nr:hypothetical protein SAMN06296020_1125 [Anoxynatronum buryatiense]